MNSLQSKFLKEKKDKNDQIKLYKLKGNQLISSIVAVALYTADKVGQKPEPCQTM